MAHVPLILLALPPLLGTVATAPHQPDAVRQRLLPTGPGCPCPSWCGASLSGSQPLPGVITVSPAPGAANCTTIQGAVELTRYGYRDRYTIEVAEGHYKEKVAVAANRPPITLVGQTDRVDGVLVQWFDCDGCATPSDPVGEWFDQTLWVGAADFRAEHISWAGGRGGGRDMAVQVASHGRY